MSVNGMTLGGIAFATADTEPALGIGETNQIQNPNILSSTAKQRKYFELSSAAQMNTLPPHSGYSAVSSAAIASLSISPTSNNTNTNLSSASSSTSSSCESGIVVRDSSLSSHAHVHTEILSKPMTKSPLHSDSPSSLLSDRRSSAIMSGHATTIAATQITPKMLNDINMAESIHKINQPHHQLLEQQQKVHQQIPLSEDPRTLQLALELSLVGLNENQNCYVQPTAQSDFELGPINVVSAAFTRTEASMNNLPFPTASGTGLLMPSAGIEDRSKKSQNMTECVPVPSSEHVAEIVGRQGCKIKALRAKTNTYIKTPVRGEEPVFVVTGRKEDVNKAKREILSAADHFSLIRASRKPAMDGHNNGATGNSGSFTGSMVGRTQSGPPSLPGQITIQVRVPYRVVGLVVGPKGATIKHIQQETQTYIVTPSREKEPIFEVTGLPENVQTARKQIEAHIALRTGSISTHGSENGTESLDSNEFATLHTINTLTQMLNDDFNPDILSSIYKNDISPTVDYVDKTLKSIDSLSLSNSSCSNMKPMPPTNCFPHSEPVDVMPIMGADKHFPISGSELHNIQNAKVNNIFRNNQNNSNSSANKVQSFCPPPTSTSTQCISTGSNSANILTRSCSSASSTASTKSTNNSANSTNSVNTPPELLNIWKNLSDSIDVDEGIGDSPSIWNLPTTVAAASHCSPAASISPTDSLLGDHNMTNQRIRHAKGSCANNAPMQHPPRAGAAQPNNPDKLSSHRECFVCNEKEVTTALVPCGHNMFCMDCANQICVAMEAVCPVCNSIVYHAMRILA
ncbi:RNA-binding protein MEX3B [Scaptodrosophila lebanonensis]|uniref:RNA-binding protein MEX3B n=1 Tax=Drosophila lebanonensis TaxID=7225 RepID=A0A6J2TWG8_DROLE|nr:RNA-binding protein MEX3B [Scaptodrosophila lebanonensis]XP_030379519.1 RNA-binding protein MEX3B [Scaptodrosophila lebanonensis]XP_030379520.1 RNA-binding protein MEX3B [Scaptodrosophila lebanonensis]